MQSGRLYATNLKTGRPNGTTNYKRTTVNANLLPFNNPSQLKALTLSFQPIFLNINQ
jgi:hypothetical protein